MIQARTTGFYNAVFLASAALLSLTFWGLWILINIVVHGSSDLRPEVYIRYNLLAIIGLLIEHLRIHGDYDLVPRNVYKAARKGLRQAIYVGGALMVTLLFLKDLNISRIFLFTFIPLSALVLMLANATVPSMLERFFFNKRHEMRVLYVGPSKRVKKMSRWAGRMSRFGLKIIGLLTDDTDRKTVCRVPVLGKIADLERIILEQKIMTLLLLEVPDETATLQSLLHQAESKGIRVVTRNSLSEKFQHGLYYTHHYGLDFITVRAEPLQDPLYRCLKRLVDILVSAPVVVFILPVLMAIVAIAQRWQSPGPLFFRQWRAGLQNQPFEILKFRTMTCANETPSKQAAQNDVRVYPFARIMRRTSLDEFPQFLNVLRGEMSLIGPRPHMVEHNAQFEKILQSYNVRSLIKPGITGLAQVRGYRGEARTDEDIRSRVECDIEYIERYSLFLDFYILVRTVYHVLLPPRSAY